MADEIRNRLVELIKQAKKRTKNANCDIERNMLFADCLIENDVVPVVRCKDCEFYNNGSCNAYLQITTSVKPDDYCSYGKRKVGD